MVPNAGGVIYKSLVNQILPLTCDWSIVLVEVDAHASALSPADAAASSPTQRDGHHTVHVGQHDGHADTWRGTETAS